MQGCFLTQEETEEAFSACFNPLYYRCLRFYRNQPNAHELAEDLVQETFLTAWRFRQKYDGRSLLLTWLTSIAHNRFIDKYRSSRRTPMGATTDFIDDLAPSTEDQDEALVLAVNHTEESYMARLDLHKFLDALTKRETLMLVLMNHGLQYNDLAVALDLPEGTVKSRVHRLREKIATLTDAIKT